MTALLEVRDLVKRFEGGGLLRGDPPKPTELPPGCPFASRCFHPMKGARCVAERPLLRVVGGSEVACHYAEHESLQPAAFSLQPPVPNSLAP